MKLSADRRSLATRVSQMSLTSVRISSALGMLSDALEGNTERRVTVTGLIYSDHQGHSKGWWWWRYLFQTCERNKATQSNAKINDLSVFKKEQEGVCTFWIRPIVNPVLIRMNVPRLSSLSLLFLKRCWVTLHFYFCPYPILFRWTYKFPSDFIFSRLISTWAYLFYWVIKGIVHPKNDVWPIYHSAFCGFRRWWHPRKEFHRWKRNPPSGLKWWPRTPT